MKRYRWLILVVFMLAAMVSQLLWLTFAPISSEIRKIFSVSAFDVSLLSMVWPLTFVLLAIPAGIFIDRHGFKKSVSLAVTFMVFFSIIRFLSIYPKNFILLLLSQTGASLSQPFIFGSINKLSSEWFPEEEGIANGLATIGLFIGMMLALVLTPMLFLSFGIKSTLLIYAMLSCIVAILFILLATEKEGKKEEIATFTLHDLWELSKKPDFLILEYGFFAGVGGFTALLTWLEEMLHSLHGIGLKEAGFAGGLMIIGGIAGSLIIPAFSDRIKKVKIFVLADLIAGALLLFFLALVNGFPQIALISFLTGFFLMSALPLVLEICNEISGKGMEGRASSLLWFFSQAGSIILIAAIAPIKSVFRSYFYSIALLSILLLIASILFIRVKSR
ncbi:MAG: MFS transporter [Thermoplasmata archaeon]|nr:MFS transporter [Thermoplasmata archaeon]